MSIQNLTLELVIFCITLLDHSGSRSILQSNKPSLCVCFASCSSVETGKWIEIQVLSDLFYCSVPDRDCYFQTIPSEQVYQRVKSMKVQFKHSTYCICERTTQAHLRTV